MAFKTERSIYDKSDHQSTSVVQLVKSGHWCDSTHHYKATFCFYIEVKKSFKVRLELWVAINFNLDTTVKIHVVKW